MSKHPLSYFVLIWTSRLFLIAGAIALGAIGLIYAQAHLYQATLRSQYDRAAGLSGRSDRFERVAHPSRAPTVRYSFETLSGSVGSLILTSAHPPTPRPNETSIRRIDIPSIGLAAMVLEGDDENTLRLAVGHIPDTAVPSLSGNVGLAGHRDTFFRPLQRIRIGDMIRVSTDAGAFQYRVTSTRVVLPEDVQVLDATQKPTLTLVTCYPFHYIGAAPTRFVVHAEMISSPLAR